MHQAPEYGCGGESRVIERLKLIAMARCNDRIEEATKRPKKRASPRPPSHGLTSLLRSSHGL
ncbi:hypothetical protein J2T58_000489 [Methanocalculus alkaliphilus]|uniref:hypothetical protein n=1 Tax=Methanocalculus alkaliphilus TaxID=768730 RepID=UPI00209D1E4F|nr:hypothetical protein [Methanocalculus alkaliphilus]MCP1714649.1 hypothetical protein [Methanocalculus alkaliphilus]